MDGLTAAAVLGVSPGATKQEITQAFRTRAKLAHPDATGSHESFVALRAAYDHLAGQASDPAGAPDTDCALDNLDAAVTSEVGGLGAHRSWFQPAATPAATSTVDLADTARTPRPTRAGARSAPPRPPRRDRCADRRDARGLSFDDHLDALLAAGH